ncbi:hypothetical protein [uncultured Microbacterium sp.]|uniref:hypothetical protein n=1 Tax=uncultured Microbacterium sp. TaxID=191216 RepID=UPI0026320E46|nr:hypothetical protein [uncultured Microbacterium sp.]
MTAFSDMGPSPRVRIDIDDADLDPAAVTVTVLQISKWGQVPVNNAPRDVAGGLVLNDYTVPAGVPVIYRVQEFDASGADLGIALSLDAAVDIPFGRVVIQDPLAPGNAVMLDADVSFAGQRGRSRPTKIYQAGGRSFAMSGLMSALESVALHCYTDTVDDADMLALILEQPVVLVRTHPRSGLPGSFYATIPNPVPDSTGHARFGRDTNVWDLIGSGVTRPSIDVIVPVYSYELFKQYLDEKYPPFGTYDDAALEWSTYISAIRNPPPLV